MSACRALAFRFFDDSKLSSLLRARAATCCTRLAMRVARCGPSTRAPARSSGKSRWAVAR